MSDKNNPEPLFWWLFAAVFLVFCLVFLSAMIYDYEHPAYRGKFLGVKIGG